LGRIALVSDLHAADAIYHKSCDVRFRAGKSLPPTLVPETEVILTEKRKRGATEDEERNAAFFKAVTVEDLRQQTTAKRSSRSLHAKLDGRPHFVSFSE